MYSPIYHIVICRIKTIIAFPTAFHPNVGFRKITKSMLLTLTLPLCFKDIGY